MRHTKLTAWFTFLPFAVCLLHGQQVGFKHGNDSHENLLSLVARPLSITNDVWLGGVGNWSNSSLWSTGVPGVSSNVLIDSGNPTASIVNLDVNGNANNVTVDSNDVLHVNDGYSLTVAGSQISNAGSISLNSSGHTTQLIINSANVTLSGGGTVALSNNANNAIVGGTSTASKLTNQETIQGAGQIGGGSLTLVNSGTINANQSTALTITAGGGTTNTGLLEATNGGTLGFSGATVTNTNGTINTSAGGFSANNSTINGGTVNLAGGSLQNSTISGATVNVTGSGNLQLFNGSLINGTLNNSAQIEVGGNNYYGSAIGGTVTNASGALIKIDNYSGLTLQSGTYNNAGTISLNSTGYASELQIAASNVTLTGGGSVNLSNNLNNIIFGASTADTLTNQETIQGSGHIGNGSMTLVNSGTINANQSNALTIDANGGTTNTGTLKATNGGTLGFSGTTVTDTNGTINTSAGGFSAVNSTVNGGTVNLAGGSVQNSTISGAKVTVAGSGNLQLFNGSLINGTLNNSAQIEVGGNNYYGSAIGGTVTNASGALIKIDSYSGLTLQSGTYNNAGTISLNSTGYASELQIAAPNVTLTGGGTVNLSNNANNLIFGAAAADTLTNQETIQGSGNIGNGSMGLVNAGVIRANQSVPLIINTGSAGFSNSGTLSVSGGSTLQITSGTPFSNFASNTLTGGAYSVAGTLQFGASGASVTTNAANISLNGTASQIIDAGGNNILKNLATNATGSSLALTGNRSFTTAGNFTNNGSLSASSGSTFAVTGNLTNLSGTTLAGGIYNIGGTLQVGNSGASIVTNSANIALNGTTSQIVDSNKNDVLKNFAVNATAASFALNGARNFTTAGNFTNSGSLTVSSGSTFAVNGNLSNFASNQLTGGSYNVGGTLRFNGANIVTNAANIMLNGPAAMIVNQSNANALANFATNAANGTFTLAGNQNLTTAGSFTNAGILTVSKGSTFGLGNAGAYTQTNGVTTVDGVLASTVNTAALNLNKGSIYGTGSLGFSVVNTGSLTPADSTTKAGLLTVNGTYKQNTGGILNIGIGGTAAGTSYDQLKVAGTASVTGTLNLSLLNGYVPAVGSSFEILTGSSVSGQFSTVNGGAINGSEHFAVTCDPAYCVATVVSGASSISRGNSSLHLLARSDGRFDSGQAGGPGNPAGPGFFRRSAYTTAPPPKAPAGTPENSLPVRHASSAPASAAPLTPQLPARNVAVSQATATPVNPFAQYSRGRRGITFGVDLHTLLSTNPRSLLKGLAGAANAPTIGYVASTVN